MRTTWIRLAGLALLCAWGVTPATTEMPQGLSEAFSAARHAIEADGDAHLASNPGNAQRIAFRDGGVEVTPATAAQDWRWGLHLTGYGTPGHIAPVAEAQRQVAGARLEYRRGPVTEWYENKAVGLEQGFTLAAPPAPDASDLVLVLAVQGGLTPTWDQPGQAVSFHTPAGGYALTYRDLKVIDAAGRRVPAQLALGPDTLEIHLDAQGAAWPIVVDPLVVNEQKVTAQVSDAAAQDYFGASVALSGDTALIGAVGTTLAP